MEATGQHAPAPKADEGLSASFAAKQEDSEYYSDSDGRVRRPDRFPKQGTPLPNAHQVFRHFPGHRGFGMCATGAALEKGAVRSRISEVSLPIWFGTNDGALVRPALVESHGEEAARRRNIVSSGFASVGAAEEMAPILSHAWGNMPPIACRSVQQRAFACAAMRKRVARVMAMLRWAWQYHTFGIMHNTRGAFCGRVSLPRRLGLESMTRQSSAYGRAGSQNGKA